MERHKLQAVRGELSGTWGTLAEEGFGRNRRNLYALSGAFILFVLGSGRVHYAELFNGSVEFENPQVLYGAAFVLLAYCYWRFEQTLPLYFVHLWKVEQVAVYRRTDSYAAMVNSRLPDGLKAIGSEVPKVEGHWKSRVTITLANATAPNGTTSGGPFTLSVPWLHYAYTRICAALIGVRAGRATVEILLPRVLFFLAVVLSVGNMVWRLYFAVHAYDAPVELS